MTFSGRTALVTGGSSGIGKACVTRLRAEGVTVFVADINPRSSDEIALDVSDSAAWNALIDDLPPLDIVLLNAGIATPRQGAADAALVADPKAIASITDEAYRAAMGVNIDGVFFGARAVIPGMVDRGHGDVLITASLAGLSPMPGDPIYGANKHAAVGLARALGAQLADTGVVVGALCPGFMDTPLVPSSLQTNLKAMGLPVADPARVADAMIVALTDRAPGAQWVIWGDEPPRQYRWNPGVEL